MEERSDRERNRTEHYNYIKRGIKKLIELNV